MRYVGLGRDHLRSHFVFRPRHAPEWLRAQFLPVVFLANEEELIGKTITTSLNTTNPKTYVKFIFLRTSPLMHNLFFLFRIVFRISLFFYFCPYDHSSLFWSAERPLSLPPSLHLSNLSLSLSLSLFFLPLTHRLHHSLIPISSFRNVSARYLRWANFF